MAKISKRIIDTLRPDPAGKDVWVWDSELRGFGVRLKPSGAASYVLQYRTETGRTRRFTLARVGTLTPEEARAKARRLLADVHDGADPSAARREARGALTVAALCSVYMDAARAGLVLTRFGRPKRPSTILNDETRIGRHIIPLIGDMPAAKLSRPAVQRMSDAIAAGRTAKTARTKPRGKSIVSGGPLVAARVVELLGGIWTWAERRGYVTGPSPIRGVEKHKAEASERILSPGELARLGAVLRDQEAARPMAVAAVRLIAMTGARREEICRLKWSEIDAANSCLRLEETKTGRSVRPIGKAALDALAANPRAGDHVFPSAIGDRQPADMTKPIVDLFNAAGLHDARSQTLRRTFASIAADEGFGDATIGELLGHARRGVTARHYIRRPDAALVAAADRVAGCIAAMLDGREAEVVELHVRREAR